MEILITSKTKKGKSACVGGIDLANNTLVRLLNEGNWDQYADTDFNIGNIWDIQFKTRNDIIPPHIEDVIIKSKRFIRNINNISEYIINSGIPIYRGSPNQIFNELLGWTGKGGGYIEDKTKLPTNSVGFWISDEDLELEGTHYYYPSDNLFIQRKNIPYVGFEQAIQTIPAGTLIRVSLARWWKPEDIEMNERCYLQLSGWYL